MFAYETNIQENKVLGRTHYQGGEAEEMNQRSSLSEQRIRNNRIRRRRELKRKKKAGVLILLMTVLFLSTFFSLRLRAEGNNSEALSKYYTSIRVKPGDTLWSYARQYGDRRYYKNSKKYVEEVMAINSLRDDTITSGQHLILPYYRPVMADTSVDGNESIPPETKDSSMKGAAYFSRS